MNLQDKLNELKANFEKQAPKEALEIMHKATDDLRKSGISERALKVGDSMPEFELENAEGSRIRSRDILAKKRIVLSDPGNAVAQKFRLVHALPEDLRKIYLQFGSDVSKHNGDDSWTLPLAARFIVDQEGVIRYAEVDVDYTIRPDPEHTIEALKSISL
jgi:peroxiredoxin